VAVPLTRPDDGQELEEIDELELELLLEAVHRRYGYDFRGYARPSLLRRLWRRTELEGLRSLSALQERVLHEPPCVQRLLDDLSITVTAMFRDPPFHAALRTHVFGELRTHPFVRAWVAGCSTGEEVLSLAIGLSEADLLDRTRIYSTDMDADVVARARTGAIAIERLREYTRNYQAAGGAADFSRYYAVSGDRAVFARGLLDEVVFAQHNLVTDGSFNEFDLILCRNVLIYFGPELQDRVLALFDASAARRGVLGLGRKESLRGTAVADRYEPLVEAERVYRRRP
jgi:chemotaxis protein methyltransferase CheR